MLFAALEDSTRYKDKWLPDEIFVEGINHFLEIYPLSEKNQGGNVLITITRKSFNGKMTKLFADADVFNGDNQSGVFWRPLGQKMYYYIKSANKDPPSYPNGSPTWRDLVEKNTEGLDMSSLTRRATSEGGANSTEDIQQGAVAMGAAELPSKRQRTSDSCQSTKPILQQTYWDSNEARRIFTPNDELDASVEAGLARRIKLLQDVSFRRNGWQLVVKDHETCSDGDVFVIRQLAQLLCRTYQLALENKPKGVRWDSICQQACDELIRIGIRQVTSGRAMSEWNRLFVQNNDTFPRLYSNRDAA